MNKEPRRIHVSEEREEQLKRTKHYSEVYVFDPDFLREYKDTLLDSLNLTDDERAKLDSNMSSIREFIIGDRVSHGLSRLCCGRETIEMDVQYADITENSFSIKPGFEYLETIFVHELFHAAARKRYTTGIIETEKTEDGKTVRKGVGLNEGITQYLAERATGKPVPEDIDSYAYNKSVVGLLADTLGEDLITSSYFKDENSLKERMNALAGDPNFYDEFNRNLDTINKLQATIRRVKNGSVKLKNPEDLERLEAVVKLQQDQLVEQVFANVILPAIKENSVEKRQEALLEILKKHENLLEPVAKYVAKHQNSDWIRDNIIEQIKTEINTTGIDFAKINESLRNMEPTNRVTARKTQTYVEAASQFLDENEDKIIQNKSTTMTPLLRKELERMVVVLDNLEEAKKNSGGDVGLEGYKAFLKKYFHKIPNLEEEIEKIRAERKRKEELDPLQVAEEEGKKAAQTAATTTGGNTNPHEENNEGKKNPNHPNLEDKFIVDNITGQVYNCENKSIFERAVTISKATGETANIDDPSLIALKEKALEQYKEKLSKMKPDDLLLARYGDKWQEALLESFERGWNAGVKSVMNDALSQGLKERKKTVEEVKKGKLPEEEDRELTPEELEVINRDIEKRVNEDGEEFYVVISSGNPVLSERTKKVLEEQNKKVETATEEELEQGETALIPKRDISDVLENLSETKLEDITSHLDIFDREPLVDKDGNVIYAPITDPLVACSLYSRYVELTGKTNDDYEDKIVRSLHRICENKDEVIASGEYTEKQVEQIIATRDAIHNDRLKRTYEPIAGLVENLEEASLEEVKHELDIYSGIAEPSEDKPFKLSNPVVAYKINERYKALTGQDHEGYVVMTNRIAESMITWEENITRNFGENFMNQVKAIKEDIETRYPEMAPQPENTEHKGK